MRKNRRIPPPLSAPRPGKTYVVRSCGVLSIGLVVSVGDRPATEEISRERMWPVSVLSAGGMEKWWWREYSGDAWSELDAFESSGALPSSPPGEGESTEDAGGGRPRRREERRGHDSEDEDKVEVVRKTT